MMTTISLIPLHYRRLRRKIRIKNSIICLCLTNHIFAEQKFTTNQHRAQTSSPPSLKKRFLHKSSPRSFLIIRHGSKSTLSLTHSQKREREISILTTEFSSVYSLSFTCTRAKDFPRKAKKIKEGKINHPLRVYAYIHTHAHYSE